MAQLLPSAVPRRRRVPSTTGMAGFLLACGALCALSPRHGASALTKAGGGAACPARRPLSAPLSIRGGGTEPTTVGTTTTTTGAVTAARKKKKKKTNKKKRDAGKAKRAIDDAMREKDAAEALGDAIRDRADILRAEDPFLQSIDWSVSSVGRALGASDTAMMSAAQQGGGVQASPTSVVANYFLKSHGGAHLLQSACGLLATASALGALLATSKQNPEWTIVLLRRTFVFAMIKHLSGLLASASIAAKAIPKIGLAQSRKWMEGIVRAPVSQYVFYTASLLLWSPRTLVVSAGGADGAAAAVTTSVVWWWPRWRWMVMTMLLSPILLREVISTILVISDVLVLLSVGSGGEDGGIIQQFLTVSQSIVNAFMSLLVSPTKWRSADPAQRQTILAGLVSRLSLAFEAGVGAILVWDMLLLLVHLCFGGGGQRPPWYEALTKIVVVRLYVHYLLTLRRTKYEKLTTEVRGGAVQLPFWVLDALYDPAKALGIDSPSTGAASTNADDSSKPRLELEDLSWRDLLSIGLGLDER